MNGIAKEISTTSEGTAQVDGKTEARDPLGRDEARTIATLSLGRVIVLVKKIVTTEEAIRSREATIVIEGIAEMTYHLLADEETIRDDSMNDNGLLLDIKKQIATNLHLARGLALGTHRLAQGNRRPLPDDLLAETNGQKQRKRRRTRRISDHRDYWRRRAIK